MVGVSRGPGRPALISGDSSELRAPQLNLRARVAWLARVSRCASSDPEITKQVSFAMRLRDVGFNASSTKVSLWENGHQAMTLTELRGYETVLGLPSGQLQAAASGLSRSLPSDGREPVLPARTAPAAQELLDTVYTAVQDQDAVGGDWFALTACWNDFPGAMVPLSIVRGLTRTLLDEMVRSCGIAYTTRFQALCQLAGHPVYGQVLVDSVLDLVAESGVEPVIDALSLLGHGVPEQTAPVLLDLARHPAGRIRVGAAHALTGQLISGVFPDQERTRLQQVIASLCAGTLDDARLARQLIVRLPDRQRQESIALLARRTAPAGDARRRLPAPTATLDLSHYERAARVATGLPGDPMLHRLLTEMHVHDLMELRHHAGLLLMASPYRESLAEQAVPVLRRESGTCASLDAGVLLSYLATPAQELPLLDALADAARPIRTAALTALTHAVGVSAQVDLVAQTGPSGVPDGVLLYAAGMSAHPQLAVWAETLAAYPDLQERCRWWQRHGSAIRS